MVAHLSLSVVKREPVSISFQKSVSNLCIYTYAGGEREECMKCKDHRMPCL